MRIRDYDTHWIHWLYLWVVALPIALFLGPLFAIEWLINKKRQWIGPREDWSPWLAWFPVRIRNDVVWMEWVERKWWPHFDEIDYRTKESE